MSFKDELISQKKSLQSQGDLIKKREEELLLKMALDFSDRAIEGLKTDAKDKISKRKTQYFLFREYVDVEFSCSCSYSEKEPWGNIQIARKRITELAKKEGFRSVYCDFDSDMRKTFKVNAKIYL